MPSPNPLKVRDYQLEQLVDLGGTSRQAVDDALGQGAGPSGSSGSPLNAVTTNASRLHVGLKKKHSSSRKKTRRDRRDETPTGEPFGRAVSFSNSPRLQPTAPMFAEQLRASPSIRATMMRSPPASSSYLRPIDQQQQGRDPILAPLTNPVHQAVKPSNLLPGRNPLGWYDMETSELFRGATERPEMRDGFPPVFPEGGESALDSDSGSSSSSSSSSSGSSRKKRRRRFLRRASTVSGTSGGSTSSRSSRGSGSSGSSSSSSGMELGRRMTRAMDFALGRRRSSSSSSSSDSDSSDSSSADDAETGTKSSASRRRRRSSRSRSKKHKKRSSNGGGSNRRRRSSRSKGGSNTGRRRARSRTFSFATRSSSPDRSVTVGGTRRKIVPTRREFSLMLPGPIGEEEDLGTGLGKSVAFAALPSRPDNKRSTTLSTIVGSPLLDPNEPAPPTAIGVEATLGQPLMPPADWRSRLMTTPSLPQVLERIKKEREKSGYEEAFLREREVKEKEKERRRERERRRRRGHRDHGDYVARARSKARHAGESPVTRDHEMELDTPFEETPTEVVDTADATNPYTGGLSAIRIPMARASSWTHSLLGHASERRSGNGRKRRAIIDLSIDNDTPPMTPQPSPPASAGLVPPPGVTEQRRSRPGKSRSRLLQMRSDYGVDDTGSELNATRRSSSLVDMPGLNKSSVGLGDEGSNASSTSSDATKADIVRPKSASDLLGIRRETVTRSHSSTHLHTHHHRKVPEFVLPPVPRPALLRGQTGVENAHQPPPLLRAIETTEVDVEIERKLGKEGCWWLDVSCPSWEDLRDLGELLHLHPLTLEDVLQQDPREKLDVFENLGYYLIVFRAIDETYFKYTAPDVGNATMSPSGLVPNAIKRTSKSDRPSKASRKKGKLEIVEDNPGKEGLEGVGVGGINIYLVVFADGIVSFHYGDISKHIDRVREKISTVEKESTNAEWIAHGLMDSIVDTFFPLIGHIDHEVDEIDSLVIDPATKPRKTAKPQQGLAVADFKATLNELNGIELSDRSSPPRSDEKDEKAWFERRDKAKPWRPFAGLIRKAKAFHKDRVEIVRLRFHLWRRQTAAGGILRMPGQAMHRLGIFLGLNLFRRKNPNRDAAFRPVFDRSLMLRRITEMRRLTTGLTRLLGSKYQVVTRLKKRAAEQNGDVGAYIGDVQDHILMLQTSLNHYEYILSHCQPAYMSYLNVTSTIVRGDISNLILALSCVTVGYMPMVLVTSMFSMNVHIPTNLGPEDGIYGDARRDDGARRPLNLWFIVLSIVFVVFIGMLLLIRYWRWQAKQASKRRRTLQVKPKILPSPTTGRTTIGWCDSKWQLVKFECRRLVRKERAVV